MRVNPHEDVNKRSTAISRLARPIVEFMHVQSSSGIVLGFCTLVALAIANSPWAAQYQAFWDTHFKVGVGSFVLDYPLWYWVNDGLMAIFFFVVGLEIKRELVLGELRNPKKVVLPVVAAAGGAVVPALIYFGLLDGQPGVEGWAIPMATDIAFVVGLLAILGNRVPHGLNVFLLTLAIADDMMAVLVIALFYTTKLSVFAALGSAASLAFCVLMRRMGVRSVGAYFVVGFIAWLFALKSGIHPTVAGVILGLLTPARPWYPRAHFADTIDEILDVIRRPEIDLESGRNLIKHTAHTAVESIAPLERLIHDLHPWVSFVIMPIFALANAGVAIELDKISEAISAGVISGLVVGKPVGIFLASFVAVKLGWAALPKGVNWRIMLGAGAMAGIGFTMSLFIAGLSFGGEMLNAAKTGVLIGSTVSAVFGVCLLLAFLPKSETVEE